MRGVVTVAFAAATAGMALAGTALAAGRTSGWSEARSVAKGPARSIGSYSAGCVQGAQPLPSEGVGFRLMRPERERHYGHPNLIEFIQSLGQAIGKAGLGTLGVGDLGQPRGGPAPTGHASHQIGLDVDLWFTAGEPGAEQRSMTQENGVSEHYGPRVGALLKLAAAEPNVDRIFVNPLIKRELCSAAGDKSWLRKVRPWWGHNEHFHVRLSCPARSPDCQAQSPLPPGDGCSELPWWLDPERDKERAKDREQYGKRVGSEPKLPTACAALLR